MNRIYAAKFLLASNATFIEDGALLAVNGDIKAVGTLAELKRSNPGVEVTEFGDESLLLPTLVNAHTHLELTDYPHWAEKAGESDEPKDFVDWILRLIRVKRRLDKRQYFTSLRHGIQQSIAAGTGAVGDILSHYDCRSVYADSSLSGVLYLESLGQEPEVISRARKHLLQTLQEQRSGCMQLGISPHSPYTVSSSYLKDLYAICREKGHLAATHLAESPAEVELIEKSRGDLITGLYLTVGWESFVPRAAGCRPADYLQQRGGMFPENLLVHGVQLNDAEIELLAQNKMSLALCPRSNARLNVGQAPAAALYQAGVKLCLGTDSLASNDSLSIWDEMAYFAASYAGAFAPSDIFQMATQTGAEALGVGARLGSLDPGKQCSFQVLRTAALPAPPELWEFLIAPGRSADIVRVCLQGQTLLSDPV